MLTLYRSNIKITIFRYMLKSVYNDAKSQQCNTLIDSDDDGYIEAKTEV